MDFKVYQILPDEGRAELAGGGRIEEGKRRVPGAKAGMAQAFTHVNSCHLQQLHRQCLFLTWWSSLTSIFITTLFSGFKSRFVVICISLKMMVEVWHGQWPAARHALNRVPPQRISPLRAGHAHTAPEGLGYHWGERWKWKHTLKKKQQGLF